MKKLMIKLIIFTVMATYTTFLVMGPTKQGEKAATTAALIAQK